MPESAKKSLVILVYLALALSTIAVFWQVRNFDFAIYDDPAYVTENPHVLNGLTPAGIIWAFTTGLSSHWHPLTWLSLMLDCQLFGPNPGRIHLVNLLLHIVNTLLLFAVFKKMTGLLWPSAFVAAAFALHPMHVESVAWISERKDVLSAFFWLLAMLSYVRYVKQPNTARYLLVLLIFALGLMTKPMLVTLPFVLLLLDYWPLDRFAAPRTVKTAGGKSRKPAPIHDGRTILYRIIIEKIPFFALVAVSSVVTFLMMRSGGTVINIDTLPLNSRIANAVLSYVRYLYKILWPQNLAVYYPFDVNNFVFWQVAMCVLLLLVISIFVIRFGRNQKYLPLGWFWFVGTLVPVIGFVQVGSQAYADRYTYVPYIGLFIMIAWGLPTLISKWPQRKIALGLSMVIVLTTLGICAHRQVSCWKNGITLFLHTIEVTQNNYVAYNHVGLAYSSLDRYEESMEAYKQAIRIKPDYADAQNNLGFAYGKLGRYQESIEAYKQAVRIKPAYADAQNNLGNAYGKLGRFTEAIGAFSQAIRLKPNYAEAQNNLGVAYAGLGRYTEAIEASQQAVRIQPDLTDAYNNLGNAYCGLGRYPDAVESYKQAIRIKPDDSGAHYNLGNACCALGRWPEAIEAFRQAIKIQPDYVEAHTNLGIVYRRLGRFTEAIDAYKQAIKIKPDLAEAHNNLGYAYLAIGDKNSAMAEYNILKSLNSEIANKLLNQINK
jgi:tetratricopeptide (TPR) repeat protein